MSRHIFFMKRCNATCSTARNMQHRHAALLCTYDRSRWITVISCSSQLEDRACSSWGRYHSHSRTLDGCAPVLKEATASCATAAASPHTVPCAWSLPWRPGGCRSDGMHHALCTTRVRTRRAAPCSTLTGAADGSKSAPERFILSSATRALLFCLCCRAPAVAKVASGGYRADRAW